MIDAVKEFRLPTQVLVYCYRQNVGTSNYLLLRRTPKFGAFWQGVTGAPEGKESLVDAANRELHEETQLFPKQLYQVDFGYSFSVEEEWKWAYHPDVTHIDEFVFLAEIAASSEPVLSFEHDLYQWAGFDQAIELLKWPNNRRALEYCDQLLRSESRT